MDLPAEIAARFAEPVDSALDVGIGIRPQSVVEARLRVGVDIFHPYLLEVSKSYPGVLVYGGWQVLRQFLPGAFDVVVALDFIEHLTRRAGRLFLAEARRVGKTVVIFTPLGAFPQPDEKPDGWGMGGGEYQRHRSAWTPDDFEGWETVVCPDFHDHDAHGRELEKPISAFWAVTTS